ncbi:galanin receptor type 2-like isoform X1 [Bacillus rossius redtenbacheri]|uniref:galanin receptor type 2-like isoform X1 n=1 Tax=Bacillus rossius redtenbacheri TaxID=93214 RepID=UPI002FDDC74E
MAAANSSRDDRRAIYMGDPEEMLRPSASNPYFADIVAAHAAALLVGVAGNLAVVGVAASERSHRSKTHLFLASLAGADLLLLCAGAPLQALQYFVLQWDEAGAVCKLAVYAELLSAVASVLNLAAVTVERFVVIVFPMQSRFLCTIRNCRCSVGLVWLLSFALAAPVLYTKETFPVTYTNGIRNVTIYHCNDNDTNGVPFAIYELFILFGAPAVLMVTCYSYVIRELWRSTHSVGILTNATTANSRAPPQTGTRLPVEDTTQRKMRIVGRRCRTTRTETVPCHLRRTDVARRARKQVIKMLMLVVVLFLACWGPRIIMELIIKIGLDMFTSAVYSLRVTFNVLPYIHACINPIIYSFMSKNFRSSLKRLCCRRRQKSKVSLGAISCSEQSTTQHTYSDRKKKLADCSSSATTCQVDDHSEDAIVTFDKISVTPV